MNLSSPKATGGAGVHFESRVAAYYLASLLVEGAVRGLGSAVAKEIRLQRRYENYPLDDVIVEGQFPTGSATLSLQVKRKLTFSSSNKSFKEVMKQSWETFTGEDFKRDSDRFGVALSIYSSKVDNHFQTVLSWARESTSAKDFFKRIEQSGLSHKSSRDFITTVKEALAESIGKLPTDDDLWSFLKHFVILRFDLEKEESSESYVHALQLIKNALLPEDQEKSKALWHALVNEADITKPAAGSISQATLRSKLGKEFHLDALRSCQGDLNRIAIESKRALEDIEISLGDVILNRDETIQEIDGILLSHQFIEVIGDPGVGKSVILRMLAERQRLKGPVLFLKHDRLSEDPGWSGQACLWQLENTLDRLLSELESVGEPILFVDGIDRIRDPGKWKVINDLFRALYQKGDRLTWRMIVSARGNALDYIQQLDPKILDSLTREKVIIPTLTDLELGIISEKNPALVLLLNQEMRTKELARKPYLLKRLIRWLVSRPDEDKAPATAIDLIKLWWGITDNPDSILIIKRQKLLLELAKKLLEEPGKAISIIGTDAEALDSLVSDDTLRMDKVRGTVTFSHDILEDWTLCILLRQHQDELPNLLLELGEPLWLEDAFKLLATFLLEDDEGITQWRLFLDQIELAGLQPRWRRSILTAPLQSTRAAEFLDRLKNALLAEDGRLLNDLLVAVRTVEIFPDYLFSWCNFK